MRGETVTLLRRSVSYSEDSSVGGEQSWLPPKSVDNVLVEPVHLSPESIEKPADAPAAKFNLYFPKAYAREQLKSGGSLRGAHLLLRGKRYRVLGDPQPFDPDNTPTNWCLKVLAEEVARLEAADDYWAET